MRLISIVAGVIAVIIIMMSVFVGYETSQPAPTPSPFTELSPCLVGNC